ncbi:hypothetical protein IMG5_172520 [Ichthyophthirius multifiliis]|uniref:Guanylate cyclase domain-containing protein n=1 Tax=Ichthyophthirius multifiliis TaxID=5932 RepID=G0R1S7_ICHMU|nr:hypothetical protein IMG5_172520 [Ichthyophthirius multifiliis]EGR28579.1 hypothetical protein IMG5_172520 [Ichthyophthirius multifiliis]|eukprot:XP_004029815.1 hypothetical protein IMG5_172520 [Ichthyophthirius multifiliis]
MQDIINSDNQIPKENIDIFQIDDQKSNCLLFQKILDNNYFQSIITILTLYALFGDDIRILAFGPNADIGFDIITLIGLIFFFIEFFFSVFAKQGYKFSFFFWLDLISIVSLILDIQLINIFLFSLQTTNAASLARAGRASRVGSRAGRVVRLVRLIRIVKLYKATQEKKEENQGESVLDQKKRKIKQKYLEFDQNKKNEQNQEKQSLQKNEKNQKIKNQQKLDQQIYIINQQLNKNSIIQVLQENNQNKESRVSKRLSDLITKRVIIIVLILLFTMPLFQADYFFDLPTVQDYGLSQIEMVCYKKESTHNDIKLTFEKTIEQMKKLETPIIYFTSPFQFIETFQDSVVNTLRDSEKSPFALSLDVEKYKQAHPNDLETYLHLKALDQDQLQFSTFLNQQDQTFFASALSLGRTVFVCIVLTFAALLFSKDANDLALRPIERMINKVNQIAKNPISAKEQDLIDASEDQYETSIIENAIIKIGTLLALGFGEAGSEIIGSNMANLGDINPMIAGKKKCAIYGFCDIRNFTDATEVLQEDVMIFVNNIGEVVHQMVDRYLGAANKNIGDAFLLVWKLPQNKYSISKDNQISFKDTELINMYSDFSLISFMKIHAKLNREPKLLAYRQDKRLSQRMKDYKIKIGFGLHIGWSIEGAIGSEFKIDASYLSPNVGMASRLEGATKNYGVSILISSQLYDQISASLQKLLRQVDFVTIKGWAKPIGFYTIDMNIKDIPQSKGLDSNLSEQEKKKIDKSKKQTVLEFVKQRCFHAETYIRKNKDLRLLLRDFNMDFLKKYNQAFKLYIQGDWKQSKQIFDEILKTNESDGPTKATLEFMEKNNFVIPEGWEGHKPYID